MTQKPLGLQKAISFICALVAAVCGMISGIFGSLIGIASGYWVGHRYVDWMFRIPTKNIFVHILSGTLLGGILGALSGASVHIPRLFIDFPSSGRRWMSLAWGAQFGIFVGLILGFIGGCLIAVKKRRQGDERLS